MVCEDMTAGVGELLVFMEFSRMQRRIHGPLLLTTTDFAFDPGKFADQVAERFVLRQKHSKTFE